MPELSVYENIFLGREHKTRLGTIDRRAMRRAADALMSTLGLDIDTSRAIGRLRVSQRQLVEIAKALSLDTKVIIMDEPTSALSDSEVEYLFERHPRPARARRGGRSTSRIGSTRSSPSPTASPSCGTDASSGRRTRRETPRRALISMMVGRDLEVLYPKAQVELGDGGPARRGADRHAGPPQGPRRRLAHRAPRRDRGRGRAHGRRPDAAAGGHLRRLSARQPERLDLPRGARRCASPRRRMPSARAWAWWRRTASCRAWCWSDRSPRTPRWPRCASS